jgi:hypothetical protein
VNSTFAIAGAPSVVEPPPHEPQTPARSTAAIGLVVVVVLAVLALFLFHSLRSQSRLQDCLMSGRTNCAPIEVPARNH